MARTPDGRGPLAIGLLVSLAAHAAALMVVTLDIPEPPPARLAVFPVRPADLEPVEPEPPIPLIEIRPPGMSVPSAAGGAAAERTEAIPAASPEAPAIRIDAPVRLTAATPSPVSLAPAAPIAPAPEIVLASTDGEAAPEEEETDGRPARGIILREGGAPGTGSGAGGSSGSGRGIFPGTGGVTTIGPGGDCITPGLVVPDGRSLPAVDRARSIGRGSPDGASGRRDPIRRSGIRP